MPALALEPHDRVAIREGSNGRHQYSGHCGHAKGTSAHVRGDRVSGPFAAAPRATLARTCLVADNCDLCGRDRPRGARVRKSHVAKLLAAAHRACSVTNPAGRYCPICSYWRPSPTASFTFMVPCPRSHDCPAKSPIRDSRSVLCAPPCRRGETMNGRSVSAIAAGSLRLLGGPNFFITVSYARQSFRAHGVETHDLQSALP